jgi:hypothetical protein
LSITERLRHAYKRLRGINIKIRKRRAKGQKTPELAAIRRHVRKKIAWLEAHKDPAPAPTEHGLLVSFDGHTVPSWIARVLGSARASGYWNGAVFSGYRSPAYSESLCYGICGAPTCSGRCAGRSSNHACPPSGTGTTYEGAVDVSDPAGLQRWCRAHGNPLHGNGEMLPYDTPHFSRSGR